MVIAVCGLVREIFKLTVFLDLDKFRSFAKLIDRKLRYDRPQPPGQTSSTGIIRELALFVAVGVCSQAIKLGPDRACEILGVLAIRRHLSRGALNGRIKICDQIFPRPLIALFASDDQTQIIRPNVVNKLFDLSMRGVRAVAKKIFLKRPTNTVSDVRTRDAPCIFGARDQMLYRFFYRIFVLLGDGAHSKK